MVRWLGHETPARPGLSFAPHAIAPPLQAMVAAKAQFQALDDDQKAAASKKNWNWSLQSGKAREQLAKHYGSLDAAWAQGWRWYPEPSPINSSHKHRFYPPNNLIPSLDTFVASNNGVKARAVKKAGADHGCQFLSSLEVIRFVASVRRLALAWSCWSNWYLMTRGV